MDERREAMLKRLAKRNEERILKAAEKTTEKKIDLGATEKAFLDSSPSTIDAKTPINPRGSFTAAETSSPILSFDEKADKQLVALATWCNIMLGIDHSEEMDFGSTKADACRKIQKILMKKSDSDIDNNRQQARRRYHQLFEKTEPAKVKKLCRKLLDESGMDESIRTVLEKNVISIRNQHSVYSDLGLQTTLLRIFLSFHPIWLKAALEAIYDVNIDAQPKFMVATISRFFVERVFSNSAMMKNKKFVQGSGKPIVTAAGKEALHRHFLAGIMKLMFLIETAHAHRVIPSMTRIFTKSSSFKCLDDMFSELTKELLTGSSATFKKVFARIGFVPTYKQLFIENYDYQAKNFRDFSDGLILAKLVETVGELPHGQILCSLRDPAGDRIRKVNNVNKVLNEMKTLGISTEGVEADSIVAGKKDSILAILWSIMGVRIAKERKVRTSRPAWESTPKKRRSAVHDDMSSEILKTCKMHGKELNIEVLDLDGLVNGELLCKLWSTNVPNAAPIQSYEGESDWEKFVTMTEVELQMPRGLDQNMALFVKTFLERLQVVREYNEKAKRIQNTWRSYIFRKKTPKMYYIVKQLMEIQSTDPHRISFAPSINEDTFTVPRNVLQERPSLTQVSERPSIDSTFDDATFTVSRDSVDALNSFFKTPKTPLRGTITRSTKIHQVIEEEEECTENDETVVPSTLKKRSKVTTLTFSKEQIGVEAVRIREEATNVNEQHQENAQNLESSKSCEMHEEKLSEGTKDEKCLDELIPSNEPTTAEATTSPVQESSSVDTVAERYKEMDFTQSTKLEENSVKSSSENSLMTYNMEESEKKQIERIESLMENQKKFVEENNLDVLFADKPLNTPELRKILRETHRLKRKQEEIFQARQLGRIEKALAGKDDAFTESPIFDTPNRSSGGHDIAILEGDDDISGVAELPESVINSIDRERNAAVTIQKTVRGFLARRRYHQEINDFRERVIAYNQNIALENEHFVRQETTDESVEMKLKNCALKGLVNENLHIVNIAATIIDRITDLVPSLLETFVVDLNGVKLIFDILNVADQGYGYTKIKLPLLKILVKSFNSVRGEKSNDTIEPLLSQLSPRLTLLLIKHFNTIEFFTPLVLTLTTIGRRFPNKNKSHLDCSYAFKTIMPKLKDQKSREMLITLQNVCDALD